VFKKMAEDGQKEPEEEESAPAEDLFSEIHLGQLKKVWANLTFSCTDLLSSSWSDSWSASRRRSRA
jgi:hypothetical protein